jgi:hypothetical protein
MTTLKHFRCVDPQVDIAPLLDEIARNENEFAVNTARQDGVHVQKETQTVFIRHAVERQDIVINQNQESEWVEGAQHFPLACAFMEDVARREGGTLSRATIVRLKPQSQVYPHIDHGAYYLIRNRYHLVLKSALGSIMIAGDEKIVMKPGELWWFDNKQHHAAANPSDEWRIHYIFDVLPDQYAKLAVNADFPEKYLSARPRG